MNERPLGYRQGDGDAIERCKRETPTQNQEDYAAQVRALRADRLRELGERGGAVVKESACKGGDCPNSVPA